MESIYSRNATVRRSLPTACRHEIQQRWTLSAADKPSRYAAAHCQSMAEYRSWIPGRTRLWNAKAHHNEMCDLLYDKGFSRSVIFSWIRTMQPETINLIHAARLACISTCSSRHARVSDCFGNFYESDISIEYHRSKWRYFNPNYSVTAINFDNIYLR